jgi:hypothetical protein
MLTIEIDGLRVEVSEFVCQPTPPQRDVELRFRCASPDFDPLLAAEILIVFPTDSSWYRGVFRRIACTIEPNLKNYTYASLGPVVADSFKRQVSRISG